MQTVRADEPSIPTFTLTQPNSVELADKHQSILSLPLYAEHLLPQNWEFTTDQQWPKNDDLIIEGSNPSTKNNLLVVRIDDANSTGYNSRVNEERIIPSGNFRLRLPLSALQTPNKTPLNLEKIRAIYLFNTETPSLIINKIRSEKGLQFSEDIIAWDFGAASRPPFSGFTRISETDPHLKGPMSVIERAGGSTLLNDGLRGISEIRLSLPAGSYHLRLWTEDRGEWEYLPHPLERRIQVNQNVIWQQKMTPETWVSQRYMAGAKNEAQPNGDVWQQIQQQRGGSIDYTFTQPDGDMIITLDGDSTDAQFLSALLLWPDKNLENRMIRPSSGNQKILTPAETVDIRLATLFRENWNINSTPAALPVNATLISLIDKKQLTESLAQTGSNSHLNLNFVIDPNSIKEAITANISVQPPTLKGVTLNSELRWGQWLWRRPLAQTNALSVNADYLRSDTQTVPLSPNQPRLLNVALSIPSNTPAGIYKGNIQIKTAHQLINTPFSIKVLDIILPDIPLPIGVYLDKAPHLSWFDANKTNAAAQCDMLWLSNSGLTTYAPPLSTPTNDNIQTFQQDLDVAIKLTPSTTLLAYTPLKRAREIMGDNATIARITEIDQQTTKPIAWSLADEPNINDIPQLIQFADNLRQKSPKTKLAAHFNHPMQNALLQHINLALINAGFGVDSMQISILKKQDIQVWLYNLGAKRVASGFYLWRSGADGYMQWHARMPTADPFDPTDGREADFQFLYPMTTYCNAIPDVDRSLFAITSGIEDLRWLYWLDHKSKTLPAAKILRQKIWDQMPDTWHAAEVLPEQTLNQWINQIQVLAQLSAKST
ncbi:MAG: hypothetical protein ACRC53_04875 [Plesiomonas sp.]|uniref:hypothetical protein n=1 Tax=Plesiomonas sp. TaxID=2486279 RepID=UPI003F36E716